jgi:uncharacterized membrane protein
VTSPTDGRGDDPVRDTAATTFMLERRLGRLLSAGTWVSTTCLGLGLGLAVVRPGHRVAVTLLGVGLVVLMATPIARVALCVVQFATERDWLFTFYTTIVFVLLVGSVIIGWLG